MSKDDQGRKYLSPEDWEDTIFSTDTQKARSFREAVHDDLDTSTRCDVIRSKSYLETQEQPFYHSSEREMPENSHACMQGGSRQSTYHQESTITEPQHTETPHRQEEARRSAETLDSIKFDGDIDLDWEKKPDQLGFWKYKYGSTAERSSHINDVERPTGHGESRYGTVEKEICENHLAGGATGGAVVSGTAGIFKTDDRSVFTSSIKHSDTESIKDTLKASEAAAYADKTWGKDSTDEKKGVFRTATGIADREIEAAVGQGGSSSEIDDRAKGQTQKYGYKVGKMAVLGSAAIGRGTFRISRYGKKLSNDVAAGLLTESEAKKLLTGKLKSNITGSGLALAGIIKTGAVHVVEDFHGSDDLGMQAITKPKDIVVGTKRTLRMAQATGKTVKKGFTATKTVAQKAQKTGRTIIAVGKKAFSNPVVLKGVGIAALAVVVIAVVISIVSSITLLFPALSLKSEDYELSQTYLYITELDARMEEDIINEDTRLHIPAIDEYHYYVNGVSVSKEQVEVYTNADLLLTYLDSKYEDYSFDGIIAGLFGTTVKGEIKSIHELLHQVDKTRWTEEIEHTSTYTDPETGEETDSSWTEYVYHMNISLTTKTWEAYYEENKDTLLTLDQQEQYNVQEIGVYTFRKELSSPFLGVDWSTGVSSRWGWRIHPISGELKQHLGLDIAMVGGTPINACNGGTIVTGNDPSGWGNYIKVVMENGDYTLYGHMSGFAVSNGQAVTAGDVIGYVGTTGTSTENHLHLEYHKGGKNLNPLIFTECEKP